MNATGDFFWSFLLFFVAAIIWIFFDMENRVLKGTQNTTFPCHTSVWWCLVCDFLGVKKTKPSISGQMENISPSPGVPSKIAGDFPSNRLPNWGPRPCGCLGLFCSAPEDFFEKKSEFFGRVNTSKCHLASGGSEKRHYPHIYLYGLFTHIYHKTNQM